jgi:hypothetical protein
MEKMTTTPSLSRLRSRRLSPKLGLKSGGRFSAAKRTLVKDIRVEIEIIVKKQSRIWRDREM